MITDFLIPRRPVSLQTNNKTNLRAWKDFVKAEASKTWVSHPFSSKEIHLTLVYLFDTDPIDVDNIIKPIQDALIGLIYEDDALVRDVDSHRRSLAGTFDLLVLPETLLGGVLSGSECVYICIKDSKKLEEYL